MVKSQRKNSKGSKTSSRRRSSPIIINELDDSRVSNRIKAVKKHGGENDNDNDNELNEHDEPDEDETTGGDSEKSEGQEHEEHQEQEHEEEHEQEPDTMGGSKKKSNTTLKKNVSTNSIIDKIKTVKSVADNVDIKSSKKNLKTAIKTIKKTLNTKPVVNFLSKGFSSIGTVAKTKKTIVKNGGTKKPLNKTKGKKGKAKGKKVKGGYDYMNNKLEKTNQPKEPEAVPEEAEEPEPEPVPKPEPEEPEPENPSNSENDDDDEPEEP